MSSAEKRPPEEGLLRRDVQPLKRPRVDGEPPASTMSKLEALEKAKRALALKDSLKERLKSLQAAKEASAAPAAAVARAVPAPAPLSTRVAAQPPSLVLDEQGRAIDAETGLALPTRQAKPLPSTAAEAEARREAEEAAQVEAFVDPSIGRGGVLRADRRRRGGALRFIDPGTFRRQAENARLKAAYGEEAQFPTSNAPSSSALSSGNANLVPLGARALPLPPPTPPPAQEWWDAKLFDSAWARSASEETSGASLISSLHSLRGLRKERISHLVQHPVQLAPPGEAPPPPPRPLALTKRELRKLRTQRRQARAQERQDLVRQGLLEVPEPRVRLANLHRVLGEEAAADPTAVERRVRQAAAERAASHADRNLARQLTPAEAREKKLRRLLDAPAADGATHVAVYVARSAAHAQLKFKLEANARENHLTGVLLAIDPGLALVVVEGGPKTLRRYDKLVLRRIDWNKPFLDRHAALGQAAASEGKEPPPAPPANAAALVWQGLVPRPAFQRFRVENVAGEAQARALLKDHGVEHYWDAGLASLPEEPR